MPLGIAKKQHAVVSHRMNSFGQPSGPSTVSWKYQGVNREVVRPDDGQPAERLSVRCGECSRELTFTVHSVAATRRRQSCWRAATWGCVVLFFAGVAGLIAGQVVWGSVAMAFGFIAGWVIGSAAAEEVGVTGHGNAVRLTVPKHHIALAEPPPAGMPELVCARCGHQEEFPRGSHLRKSYVQQQYRDAQARFAGHRCR